MYLVRKDSQDTLTDCHSGLDPVVIPGPDPGSHKSNNKRSKKRLRFRPAMTGNGGPQ